MSITSVSASAAKFFKARTLLERQSGNSGIWSLETITGRFITLDPHPETGIASLSLLVSLICEAQMRDNLVAWIAGPRSIFFPPDFAAAGVDLTSLPIVRAPDAIKAARVADTLLRSGSFALVILDGDGQALPLALQTRLTGLAHQHHTALVSLRAPGSAATRSSLVSLRCTTRKHRVGHDCFYCEMRAVKDKRQPPGWTHQELRHGPYGMY